MPSIESQLIENNFQSIQGDLADMKSSMSKMADALAKIAVLEERHQVMSATMLRIMEKLENLDAKQNELTLAQVKQDTTIKVSMRAIQVAWAFIGSGVLLGAWQVVKLVAAQ